MIHCLDRLFLHPTVADVVKPGRQLRTGSRRRILDHRHVRHCEMSTADVA